MTVAFIAKLNNLHLDFLLPTPLSLVGQAPTKKSGIYRHTCHSFSLYTTLCVITTEVICISLMTKLLIIDDSPILRERLITLISEIEGINVVGKAETVPGAIESIRKLKPDVIILDIRMPGGSGLDVLRSAKKDKPATVVIIFTNYPYPQYRKKCMDLGADFFFDKSSEFEKIPEFLEQLVRNRDAF